MNGSENPDGKIEQVGAEARKSAVNDINRTLVNLETRKRGLITVIRAGSPSLIKGYLKNINEGVKSASKSAQVLGDSSFQERLDSTDRQFTELSGMIPEGSWSNVSTEEKDGLIGLVESVTIPGSYEPVAMVPGQAVPEVVGQVSFPGSEKEVTSDVPFVAEAPTQNPQVAEVITTAVPEAIAPALETPPEKEVVKENNPPVVPQPDPVVVPPVAEGGEEVSVANVPGVEEDNGLPAIADKFEDVDRVERIRKIVGKKKEGEGEKNPNKGKVARVIRPRNQEPVRSTSNPEVTGMEDLENAIQEYKKTGKMPSNPEPFSQPNVSVLKKGISGLNEKLKIPDEPKLPDIIDEVRQQNDKINLIKDGIVTAVTGIETAEEIKRINIRFGSGEFGKLSLAEKEAEIDRVINLVTSNESSRADLKKVFRRTARLDGVKEEATNASSAPIQGVSKIQDRPILSTDGAGNKAESNEDEEPNLDKIISGVVKKGTYRGEGQFQKSVSGVDATIGIRRLAYDFGKIDFNKLPRETKEAQIIGAVNDFTADPDLRGKLLKVYRKNARLDIPEVEVSADATIAQPVASEVKVTGSSDHDEPIGPQLPAEIPIIENVVSAPEGDKNPEKKLELVGNETLQELARKLSELKTVPFTGRNPEGKVVADFITESLDFFGTDEFRRLKPVTRISIIQGLVKDLQTIDPRIADLPDIKRLEEALLLNKGVSDLPENKNDKTEAPKDVLPEPKPEISLPAPEAPPRPEAPKVAPEKPVEMISSPSAEITKAVLEDPAGFDIGRAMDVSGFDLFIIESEKLGKKVDMDDKESVRKMFEVFATKDAVADNVHALYAEAIMKDIGLSLDDEGKKAVREHIERQAHNNPEAVRSLAEKIKNNKELTAGVAELERQLTALKATLSPEAQTRAKQCLLAKQRNFQVALDTNDFWTGAGWTHSIAALFGSKASAEKARIRAEVGKTRARSRGWELIGTFGQGLSSEELQTGLHLIEIQIDEIEQSFEKKNLMLDELNVKKAEVYKMLEAGKIELFADSELKAKLVGLARVKVREKIFKAVDINSSSVEGVAEAHELFERAVNASLDNNVDYVDEPGSADSLTVLKGWLDTALDNGIERDVERAITHSMALSSERFGALQKALDKLTAKEKLGSKSRAEVRRFIVKKLEKELQVIAGEKFYETDDKGKKQALESKQKAIHLKALVAKQKEAIVLNK